ncbi:hypothetical protein [Cerasicoccus maritimus]|uniref:hypothetical protein n=1 Tax=Cerasicoccus maritimus TaxID=490089 RepID=UPI00285261F0|nr:hypothetical protein [Cerasicoccus maritimus]
MKTRKSKHTITPTLKRQARVTVESKRLHRGPKTFDLAGYSQPRDLTYIDATGAEKPIVPGVCFEADDMHLNEPFWIDWPDSADPCAARHGVRAFRAQLIPWIDIGSARFVAYSLVLRYSDAYRAKDIRWAINQVFHSVGVPEVLRFEHGAWEAKDVEEIGADSRLCRITHAQTSKGKFIENRLNHLQKALALDGVHLGRKRGEFEEANKLWLVCRDGRKDPRQHFCSLAEVTSRIDAALAFCNNDPLEGDVYNAARARELYGLDVWNPDDIWHRHVGQHPLRQPTLEESWRVQPEIRVVSVSGGLVSIRCEEFGARYWFFHEELARLGTGWKVKVAFDPADPERGAALINAEPRDGARNRLGLREGEFIGIAEPVDNVPQFSLADRRNAESRDGFDRKSRYQKLCRLLYREISPFGRRQSAAKTTHHIRDGRGNVAEIKQGQQRPAAPESRHAAGASERGGQSTGQRNERKPSKPTRRSNPLFATVDY